MKKTIVINLVGAPGVGKSTFATNLFAKMKQKGMSCEYVEEFAKGLVWEDRAFALKDQLYIFAQQNHSLLRVKGKVNVIITDSPLLLLPYYNMVQATEFKIDEEAYNKLVLERFNSYDNLVYLLRRDFPYNSEGRYQTEEESNKVEQDLIDILSKFKIDYEIIYGNEQALDNIVRTVSILLKAYNNESRDNKELERRFLIKDKNIFSFGFPSIKIQQTYLRLGSSEKRIRKIEPQRFYFTEKFGSGAVRKEFETKISEAEYDYLKENYSKGYEVVKRRYTLPLEGAKKCELNKFESPQDLELVEVEFDNEEQMGNFVKPVWFGEEVTDDERFNSASIALNKK